jgi:hypothetical protein
MANEMRQQSTEFYGQITALMQFVDNFEQQKNKYNESSGEECINFHERLDALSGTKPKPAVLAVVVAAASVPKLPVGGGVVEEQPKVERVYEDSELGQLSNVMARGMYKRLRNEGNTAAAAIRAALTEKYPDLEIEPKYTGGSVVTVAASAPKLPVAGGLSALFGAKLAAAGGGMLAALGANQPKFIYAKLSPMRSLVTWLNKDDKKLKEEIAGELAKARSSNMSDTSVLINAFYKPLMEQQIAYLQQVDYSKLEKEEDAFYLVRQVLSTVDLYLRIKRHEKLFSGVALNVASKNERKKFEDECFSQKNYTIFHIIKAFKTPVSLNANQTNDLLVRIKTGHSDLKRLIGNTIIEAFEAGSINIIDPVITAIESY